MVLRRQQAGVQDSAPRRRPAAGEPSAPTLAGVARGSARPADPFAVAARPLHRLWRLCRVWEPASSREPTPERRRPASGSRVEPRGSLWRRLRQRLRHIIDSGDLAIDASGSLLDDRRCVDRRRRSRGRSLRQVRRQLRRRRRILAPGVYARRSRKRHMRLLHRGQRRRLQQQEQPRNGRQPRRATRNEPSRRKPMRADSDERQKSEIGREEYREPETQADLCRRLAARRLRTRQVIRRRECRTPRETLF